MAVDIDGVNSTISTDKLIPQSGTALQIGESGDTVTLVGTASGFGGGKVLQCLTVQKTNEFTTSSATYVDVTDVTLDITPSATTSKILVILNSKISGSASGYPIYAQFLRDSTVIGSGTGSANEDCFASSQPWTDHSRYGFPADLNWLDSPSSTSALTYKMQVRAHTSAAVYVNRSTAVHTYGGDYATSLTLVEIGA